MSATLTASPAAAQSAPHVMVHGTFDVANYGDLLFPHLLSFGLHPLPHRLTAVSPRGGRPDWADTIEALPVAESRALRADLHVVGGGNIITAGEVNLAEYRGLAAAHGTSLWRDVSAQAARDGARLAWNAPGVPVALAQSPDLAEALARCDLLSVRDAASARNLGPGPQATVVPDTALDLARMWPAHTLDAAATHAFTRHGLARPPRWVALHANARYLNGDAAAMAAFLSTLAVSLQAVPVLLALGPCHGDDALVRRIGAHMPPGTLVLHDPGGLREVAGLIAHAEAYAGSSLHGLVTALSYGRPGMVVAGGKLEKFAGFLAHLDMPARWCESWPTALQRATRLLAPLDASSHAAIARAQDRIAAHWARLRALLGEVQEPLAAPPVVLPRARRVGVPAPPTPRSGAACNICGGTTFRQVATLPDQHGAAAPCVGCGATERHRALRRVLDALRGPAWRQHSCLALGSPGRIAAAGWFAASATTAAPGARHDLILAIDALEAAPDLAAALAHWQALLQPGGAMVLAMRTVPGRAATMDWGFPRADREGEYRAFGRDVAEALPALLPDLEVAELRADDPVTGALAIAFLAAHALPALAGDGITVRRLRLVAA